MEVWIYLELLKTANNIAFETYYAAGTYNPHAVIDVWQKLIDNLLKQKLTFVVP